ncbi:MAG: polysaccharide biosynthesis/export family protein [Gemmatimonadaceae bacterium]
MTSPRTSGALCASLLLAAVLFVSVSGAAAAQQVQPRDTVRAVQATRAQLTARAAALQSELQSSSDGKVRAAKEAELSALNQRLANGDFQAGDRIALIIRSDSAVNDTVVVRKGQVIQLKNLPDISLHGVLHSELNAYLTKEFGKYYRNPEVLTTSLMQIAVLGEVAKPGFYSVPTDVTLSDAVMAAGGPTQTSDLNDTEIRRNDTKVFDKKAVQQAFADGSTIDQMNLHAGDAIVVGEKKKSDWIRIAQIGALTAGVAVSVYSLAH